jgi:hypothetical protein
MPHIGGVACTQFCTTVTPDADVHAGATHVANGQVEGNGAVLLGR